MNITSSARMLIRHVRLFRIMSISRTSPAIIKFRENANLNVGRNFCSVFSKSPDYSSDSQLLELSVFEPICVQTLEALTEYFEEIVEADNKLMNGDVSYSVSYLVYIVFHNNCIYSVFFFRTVY